MTLPKTFRRAFPGIALAMGVAMTAMTTTLVVAQEGALDENRPIVIERVLVKVNGEILTQSDPRKRSGERGSTSRPSTDD